MAFVNVFETNLHCRSVAREHFHKQKEKKTMAAFAVSSEWKNATRDRASAWF